MSAIHFSPLTAIAAGPTGPPSILSVGSHSSPSTAIAVTASRTVTEADNQRVLIRLTVPDRMRVKGVRVCYQVFGGKRFPTYISQVRLSGHNQQGKHK